jgi:hypothetical protein
LNENRTTTMRSTCQLLVVLFLAACVSTQPPQGGTPAPSLPTPAPIAATPGSWTFTFTPGTVAYRVSRSAAIENISDSSRREITTNATFESLSLQPAGDTIGFTAAVDTFSTTTQGAIGTVQPVQLPIRVAGSLIRDSLTIAGDSLSEKCNPATTVLITDLHNLLPHFPTTLSTAASWRDSTSLAGCQGSIPIDSHIGRSFRVLGESNYDGLPVLVIERTDTIQAAGEGAQQQHRLQLKASGIGSAMYYMDTHSGRILRLTVSQDLNLTITASGKASNFRQNAKEEFTLVR